MKHKKTNMARNISVTTHKMMLHLMGQLCKTVKAVFSSKSESIYPTSYFCCWLSNSHSIPVPSHFPVFKHIRSSVIPPAFCHDSKAHVLCLPVESMFNSQYYFQGLKDSSVVTSAYCTSSEHESSAQYGGDSQLLATTDSENLITSGPHG